MIKDVKGDVLNNPILKHIIDRIEDKEEKEKTVKAIEMMLEQLQEKFVRISENLQTTKK